jgi:hypothetical protein
VISRLTTTASKPPLRIRSTHARFSAACPRCRSTEVEVFQAKSVWEQLIESLGAKILRCHQCMTRFSWF